MIFFSIYFYFFILFHFLKQMVPALFVFSKRIEFMFVIFIYFFRKKNHFRAFLFIIRIEFILFLFLYCYYFIKIKNQEVIGLLLPQAIVWIMHLDSCYTKMNDSWNSANREINKVMFWSTLMHRITKKKSFYMNCVFWWQAEESPDTEPELESDPGERAGDGRDGDDAAPAGGVSSPR